jgi:hypothetical protein
MRWEDLKEDSYFLIHQKWWSYKYIPIPRGLLDFLLKYKEEKFKNNFVPLLFLPLFIIHILKILINRFQLIILWKLLKKCVKS